MFAIIKTGGKQYRVQQDDIVVIEKLEGEVGDTVTFEQVLAAGDKIGAPMLEGASVSAEIVDQFRGRKIIIFKKRRRQGSRTKNGHRQSFTKVQIKGIKA